jgi:Ca-activated chloride channel family protein
MGAAASRSSEAMSMNRPMNSFCRRLSTVLAVAVAAACTGVASAAEPPAIIVILDHSRSMWGPLEGAKQPKYLMTREALRAALGKLGSRTRVGLAAFGHRRNECSDVEVLRPPEPVDVDRLMQTLEPLTPRGTGPLSLALREAAKALPKDGGARSIVLIHDDADNCQSDLCTVAGELRAAGITAYVIGLGTKAADLGKMACLPQLTGGRHFNAVSVEQAAALVEEALRSAAPGETATTGRPASQMPIVAPEPVPTTGPAALHLRAVAAANTAPLSVPLTWTVASEEQPDVALFDARAPNAVVPIPPGRYIVEAREGAVAAKQTVEVRGNRPIAVTMVLNAGNAHVRALAAKAATVIADAVVTISDGTGALLNASKTGEIDALLPAGRYMARVEIGVLRAEHALTISAGRQVDLDIPLNVARLQLTSTGREPGTAPETVILSVVEDDPDAPHGRRELARSAAQQASFVVPPGSYYVVARQGLVEARERLAIGPGEEARRALNIAAGRLALATRTNLAEAPGPEPVSYTVLRLDGFGQETLTTSLPAPTLSLPSGRYRVDGRYGPANGQSAREVEVKAGQTVPLVLEPPVGMLRLRLTGAGYGETWWEIFDDKGKGVWMDGQPQAKASLQAGRYVVRAETRGKRYERAVELRAGEVKLVDIAAQ